MPARLIDGTAVSTRRRAALAERVAVLAAAGRQPCLAAITVRADAGWAVYAKNQAKACAAAGMAYRSVELPADAGMEHLAGAIEALNIDPAVHGIIVQSPLPTGFDQPAVQALLSPDKDVEGVGPANLGLVLAGRPALAPCTAVAAVALAVEAIPDLTGVEAVVVGASTIVGKPVAMLLQARGATVTLCQIHTRDVAAHTRRADLLVVAVGRAGLITADMVKPGAVVVDVGINRVPGPDGKSQVVGDVQPAVAEVAGQLTPVPGGVGALTTTILLEATVDAAERLGTSRPALDANDLLRLLGADAGLDPRAADRLALILARHLPSVPVPALSPLEARLRAGVVVFDGAMGTELIARGVAPGRVTEAVREHPDLVLTVHRSYLDAGAAVLVADTFTANRVACGDRATAVALAQEGVRLARQAAAGRALVLGSIGPIAGGTGEAYAEVAQAMQDAGADGILLETFTSTPELLAALTACRRQVRIPLIASRTLGRDDAVELAEFAQGAEAAGAAAVGVNCAGGPRLLQPVVARLARLTALPVVVRPNAGFPTREHGRLRYHLRPDYFVAQARQAVAAGAAAVGGCCGIGPEHIRALAAGLTGTPLAPRQREPAPVAAEPAPVPTHPLLGGAVPWAWLPGRMTPITAALAAKGLAAAGAKAIGLLSGWPGAPSGARLAATLRHAADAAGIEPILDLVAGQWSPAQAQDLLLHAHLLGIRLVVIDDGVFADSGRGDQPAAGGGAADLLAVVAALNRGRDHRGGRIDQPTAFTAGVRISSNGAARAADLRDAGAAFVCLQPVYDPARFKAAVAAIPADLPLVAEVLVLPDAATADELDNELPGLSVPDRLKQRLAQDPEADLRSVGRFTAAWKPRLAAVGVLAVEHGVAQAERAIRGI